MAAHPALQRRWAVLAVMILAGMVVTGVAPAASATSPPSCRVANETQGTDFASDSGQALVDAIAAAVPGDQLIVIGTCTGTFRLDKSLTLTGISQKRFPIPTLDGQQAGTTLTVGPGVAATFRNLTITGGAAAVRGGGIFNDHGSVTLRSSTVSGNTAEAGGGIFNNEGSVTLRSSTVSANTAVAGGGGGIYNFGFGGTVALHSSTVSANTAGGSGSTGGGIRNLGTTLTLDSSTVRGNSAEAGGGIFSNSGSVTLRSSTVSGNMADDSGGGIYNLASTLTLDSSTVSGNSADHGGGIFNNGGSVTLRSSTMSGNTAHVSGGGIYNVGSGTITLEDSIVSGNIPDNCVNVPGC